MQFICMKKLFRVQADYQLVLVVDVTMLSGGIDSPVAGMEVMRRGVTIEAIHFHSPPFTSDQAKEKLLN